MDNSIVYTDGVQYFSRNPGDQGAYWLLDMMMFDLIPHNRNEEFLVIEADVKDNQTISGLKRVPPFFVCSIREGSITDSQIKTHTSLRLMIKTVF